MKDKIEVVSIYKSPYMPGAGFEKLMVNQILVDIDNVDFKKVPNDVSLKEGILNGIIINIENAVKQIHEKILNFDIYTEPIYQLIQLRQILSDIKIVNKIVEDNKKHLAELTNIEKEIKEITESKLSRITLEISSIATSYNSNIQFLYDKVVVIHNEIDCKEVALKEDIEQMEFSINKKKAERSLNVINAKIKEIKNIEINPSFVFSDDGLRLIDNLKIIQDNINHINVILQEDIIHKNKSARLIFRGIVLQIFLVIFFLAFTYSPWFKQLTKLDMHQIDSGKILIPIIGIPIAVILWSYLGSLGAMLYRYNKKRISNYGDSLKWLIIRPLQGLILSSAFYLALKSGQFLLSGSRDPTNGILFNDEVIMLISFLTGFSDKFVDRVFSTIVDKITNKKQPNN
jgi:hypothetical protein